MQCAICSSSLTPIEDYIEGKQTLEIIGWLCANAKNFPFGVSCHTIIFKTSPLKPRTNMPMMIKRKSAGATSSVVPPVSKTNSKPIQISKSNYSKAKALPSEDDEDADVKSKVAMASDGEEDVDIETKQSKDKDSDDEIVLSQKDLNVESLITDNCMVRRQPLMSALTIKGEEKISGVHRAFKLPQQDPSKITIIHTEIKRKALGCRGWKRVDLSGGRHIVPIVPVLPLPELLPPPVAEPESAPVVVVRKEEKAPENSVIEPLVLWSPSDDDLKSEAGPTLDIIDVPFVLCKFLREHQREGVRFMADCVLSQRIQSPLAGVILADDMGLGKTLQSISLLYSLMCKGMQKGKPIVKRAVIVCPTSLVSNWFNELGKWLQDRVKALAATDPRVDKVSALIDVFLNDRMPENILIISYETYRRFDTRLNAEGVCDLLICDEAHRLKNAKTATYASLDGIKCRRRILLSGTPLQNDLDEFYAMINFTNRGVIGERKAFRKYYELPILAGREPDASEAESKVGLDRSSELSAIVNQFVLRRTNVLLSAHLPPKVVQVVCCRSTPLQVQLYKFFLQSKMVKSVLRDGSKCRQVLPLINNLKRLCNHPKLVFDAIHAQGDEEDQSEAASFKGCENLFPKGFETEGMNPHYSGKMSCVHRLLTYLKAHTKDRVVIVSNYTSTLNLFTKMCEVNRWGCIRLDGSTTVKKRQILVDELNDLTNNAFVFLLSSKAGGCGLNLVGANRLILFDPDWNPAVDKQAAARIWRDGQKKRCFVYRFLTTGTIEEKVFQRQLSKEGLADVLGGAASDSLVSMEDLRKLFELNSETLSDTHDTTHCNCYPTGDKENELPRDSGVPMQNSVAGSTAHLLQRGEPKEEDLANWAHHSSSQSMPDPCFRASHSAQENKANRPDYVTFVFSCEVKGRDIGDDDRKCAASVIYNRHMMLFLLTLYTSFFVSSVFVLSG
jgi:DNA repair and recombination RAD54-like protein